jgi:hypothetical protein
MMLDTLTIEPPEVMAAAAACAVQYAPMRFRSSTARNCSGDFRNAGTAVATPALFTRPSTRPKVSVARRTSRWQSSTTVTSVGTTSARRPIPSTAGRRRLEHLRAPGADDHVGARLGDRDRDGGTQARGRAGDDHHAALEPERVQDPCHCPSSPQPG